MIEIKTLVYFDLEATGLKSSGKPRISEISLVAVDVEDVLDLQVRIGNHFKKKSRDHRVEVEHLVPRVINKLTLCVYPMATIMPVVTNITGLDNYNLTDQARFDKNTVSLLNIFLDRLPSPVCLVAHNGDNYDFPLLKAELEKAGGRLEEDIFCVDSYIGIKEIFSKQEVVKGLEIERKLVDKELEAVTELLAAGEFDLEMEIDSCSETQTSKKRPGQDIVNSSDLFKVSKISKLENESTPKRSGNALMKQNNDPMKMKQVSCSALFKSRKKLTFSSSSQPPSYSLINLHKHLLGMYRSMQGGTRQQSGIVWLF